MTIADLLTLERNRTGTIVAMGACSPREADDAIAEMHEAMQDFLQGFGYPAARED